VIVMKSKFITDQGIVRSRNEDAGGTFYNQSNQLLAIVADGMGGHQAGDVASTLAVLCAKSKWEKNEVIHKAEEAEQFIQQLIVDMNELVFGSSKQHEQYEGMGTTVVIAICTPTFVSIGHVGDSRCYMYSETGFKQLTKDHSYVNELVRSGEISEADAEDHPNKNVLLQVIGTDETVKSDIQSLSFEYGDALLLCSDGLYNKVSQDEIVKVIEADGAFEARWQPLVDLANERGGEDNITLVAVLHNEKEEEV